MQECEIKTKKRKNAKRKQTQPSLIWRTSNMSVERSSGAEREVSAQVKFKAIAYWFSDTDMDAGNNCVLLIITFCLLQTTRPPNASDGQCIHVFTEKLNSVVRIMCESLLLPQVNSSLWTSRTLADRCIVRCSRLFHRTSICSLHMTIVGWWSALSLVTDTVQFSLDKVHA